MTIFDCLKETHERNERKREEARAMKSRPLNLSEYDETRGAWLWTFGVIVVLSIVAIILIARAI